MARSGRHTRSAIAAVVTTALAVAAHAIGHGETPPLLALTPVSLAVWGVSYTVSVRRLARWEIFALLGTAQFAVHELSVLLENHPHEARTLIDPTLMSITHVVSTVSSALLLSYGERVWWHLLSCVECAHSLVRHVVATTDGAPPHHLPTSDVHYVAHVFAGAVGMRAPPGPLSC